MSYLDWYVGMPVVCIDGSLRRLGTNRHVRGQEMLPEAGETYTIREIGFLYPSPFEGHLCVRLSEIINQPLGYCHAEPYEAAFGVERFRPVQKRATDISIFTALLNPTPEQIADLANQEHADDARELEEFILAHRDERYPR